VPTTFATFCKLLPPLLLSPPPLSDGGFPKPIDGGAEAVVLGASYSLPETSPSSEPILNPVLPPCANSCFACCALVMAIVLFYFVLLNKSRLGITTFTS